MLLFDTKRKYCNAATSRIVPRTPRKKTYVFVAKTNEFFKSPILIFYLILFYRFIVKCEPLVTNVTLQLRSCMYVRNYFIVDFIQ